MAASALLKSSKGSNSKEKLHYIRIPIALSYFSKVTFNIQWKLEIVNLAIVDSSEIVDKSAPTEYLFIKIFRNSGFSMIC